MKKTALFAALLAIAASCTDIKIEQVEQGTKAPDICATTDNGTASATKSILVTDAEGVGTIYWKPADQINVFYGTTSALYTSQNTENATTAVFTTSAIIGSTESASTNIWGLYPYNAEATCDGNAVTTTIPAAQSGVAGTFDDDLYVTLGHSTSNELTFYNVCGGIKFSLSRDDIQTITFKGNNDEDIAGTVSLSMSDNIPAANVTSGEKTITLTPKTGSTFAKDTYYYIVCLPVNMTGGFTMTFETATLLGTFNYTTKAVNTKRSVFSKKDNIDSYAVFADKAPEHEYVDLGLSVKWATCNLGATNPEDYGLYFAWGETTGHNSEDTFYWVYYPLCNGYNKITKYMPSAYAASFGYNGFYDNKDTLESCDDAATVNWGGNWRMPTYAEFLELCGNSTQTWVTENGVNGYKFQSTKSGYTDNFIFLPAAGYYGSYLKAHGSHGSYWSSSLCTATPKYAYDLGFNSDAVSDTYLAQQRDYGLSIRPVCE